MNNPLLILFLYLSNIKGSLCLSPLEKKEKISKVDYSLEANSLNARGVGTSLDNFSNLDLDHHFIYNFKNLCIHFPEI